MGKRGKTRRDLLADGVRLLAGTSLAEIAGCFPDVGGTWPYTAEACLDTQKITPIEGASKVVEVFSEDAATTPPEAFKIDADKVRPMLEAALSELGGSPEGVWRRALWDYQPGMTIGIKVNCLNPDCPTSVPLVKALVDVLKDTLGIDGDHIIVWDRTLHELTLADDNQFTEASVGARVMGTMKSVDDKTGPGYDDALCGAVCGRAPRLSNIFTKLTDMTINVPVLKTHGVSGVTAAFKNIYGIINRPGDYHTNLATALPALYRLPPVRTRMRLHVVDALRAVTKGGTSDVHDRVPKRLLVSMDPLAMDVYALRLVNDLRATDPFRALDPIDERVTTWIQGAFDLGLGAKQAEVVRLTL